MNEFVEPHVTSAVIDFIFGASALIVQPRHDFSVTRDARLAFIEIFIDFNCFLFCFVFLGFCFVYNIIGPGN